MRPFSHINARTVRQACALLREYDGRAVLNAGGTDLLSLLKGESLFGYPEAVINVKTVRGLDYVRRGRKGLRIGATARLSDIAASDLVNGRCKVLADAARSVASPQVRNAATIGGNLCQDVRCWYYRYPRLLGGPIGCFRKGGGPCPAVRGDNRYHAVLGAKKCFAVCPSDAATALAALDADLLVAGPESERRVGVADFFGTLGRDLAGDEMVREITVPEPPLGAQQTFLKFTLRRSIDFAVVSVASVIAVRKGVCEDARIALGALGPAPVRARAAEEALKGKPIGEAAAEEAAALALAGAKALSMNGYKIEVAKVLVKRAILGRGAPDTQP